MVHQCRQRYPECSEASTKHSYLSLYWLGIPMIARIPHYLLFSALTFHVSAAYLT
ncbi:MAG: hypothetical protein DID90_2727552970 [Candidatus Nitrotoga sp. LAW]|nr:MAG: hypothetical protein DID90_2727552970 [Candidatus Nitrotoga sp. LAW]